ncbi:MAG: septation protein [Gammaproteobacteria bacterium]|jgi:intracellular septation protein|nr:septation protein [Gammaproteobacteria bacterium]
MKFFADLFPIILFFIVYKFAGIYAATAAAIVASVLQVAYSYFKAKKVDSMQWVTLAIIVVLGGATLVFHNELFIKWKPTAIEWAFAIVFLLSQWFGEKTLTQRLMESNLQLPPELWIRLNFSWVAFFGLMGALNIYVIYHFDTNIWVNFKLFGMLGFTVVFVLWQAFYISKYVKE